MSPAEGTVHIVDDDASFLTATARLLRASGFSVRTYGSANEFLQHYDLDAPGCVVADLHMPGLNGLGLQSAVSGTRSPLPMLFLTGKADIVSTVQAMRGGAEDFLEKLAPQEHLLDAVRRALSRDGRERANRERQQALHARFASLTERERSVLEQVLRGRLNKQIAGDLGIHERTVKLHRTAITSKLGVRSVAEIVRLAQDAGLSAAAEASAT